MRPLLLSSLLMLTACGSPDVAPAQRSEPGLTLHVVPMVRPASARALLAFTPYAASDLQRVTLTLEDITTGHFIITSADVAGATGRFVLRDLQPYRQYRLRLQGFRDQAGQERISVDDASSITLDTTPEASGTLATVREVRVPLKLADRPFRGILDAEVHPAAGQTGMVVRLQREVGNAWVNQLATDVQGAASAAVAFEGLALDARYRLVREGYTGATPTVAFLPNGLTAVTFDTASGTAGVTESGEVASVTLGGS